MVLLCDGEATVPFGERPYAVPLRRLWETAEMNLRIADTFTASLARLTGDGHKAVKTTAFDL